MDSIEVAVLDVNEEWLTITYWEDGQFKKSLLPRTFLNVSIRGAYTISKSLLKYTMPDYDVDITGKHFGIDSLSLQNELRQAGIWNREDYSNVEVVARILKRHANLAVNKFVNEIVKE